MAKTKLTDNEIFAQVATYVDEVFSGIRKGVPQTFYVAEVKAGAEYWDGENMVTIDEDSVGFYRTYSNDLSWEDFDHCCRTWEWDRCKPVEEIITNWEYT